MTKERPIIFSPEMIRGILDGRKTMTRRIIKLPADACDVQYWNTPSGRPQKGYANPGVNYWTPSGNHIDPCPYGQPGDRLYVKETFRYVASGRVKNGEGKIRYGVAYKADGAVEWDSHITRMWDLAGNPDVAPMQFNTGKWRPSIHMRKCDSRILLEIEEVRTERLQDITEEDAMAEGVLPAPPFSVNPYTRAFIERWNSLNAKRGYGWDANPWVWVIRFKILKPALGLKE